MKQLTHGNRNQYLFGLLLSCTVTSTQVMANDVFATLGQGEKGAWGTGFSLGLGEDDSYGLTLDFNRFDGLEGDALLLEFIQPIDTAGISLDKNWRLGEHARATLGAGAQFSLSELSADYYNGDRDILLDKYTAIPSIDFKLRLDMTQHWNLLGGARYLFATDPLDSQYIAYVGLGYRFGGTSTSEPTYAPVVQETVQNVAPVAHQENEAEVSEAPEPAPSPQLESDVAISQEPVELQSEKEGVNAQAVPEITEVEEPVVVTRSAPQVPAANGYCLQTGAFNYSLYRVAMKEKVAALYPDVRLSDKNPVPTLYLVFTSDEERQQAITKLQDIGAETFSISCHKLY